MFDEGPRIAAELAERIVAGCVLRGPDEVDDARGLLTADDFGTYPPRLIFETAGRLRDGNERIDAATVLMTLSAGGKAADLGPNPAAYLGGLIEAAPTAANLAFAAARVRDAAIRRNLIRLASEVYDAAHSTAETADEVTARVVQRVAALSDGRTGNGGPVPLSVGMATAAARYEDAAAGNRSTPAAVTGIRFLDQLTGGLAPGTLNVLGARPGVGKTALALNVAEAAARQGSGVLVVSLEMGLNENVDRLVSSAARVQLSRLRGDTRMEPDQADRVAGLFDADGFAGLPVWIDDRPGRTVDAIAAVTRRLVRRRGIKVLVVDYLQLVRPDNPREPRHLQVGQMTRRLKELARSTGVAVLCLAQLNREIEGRGDGRPKLSDLRDSGEIEQDADTVMLLHRLDDDELARVHRVDLILAKNRGGPTATVGLDYQRPFVRFEERLPLGV